MGLSVSRRGFLGAMMTAPLAAGADDCRFSGDADVIVAGGGPAGIAAACAAARAGARVLMFEMQGSLGGVWTSGLLGFVLDFGRSDTAREIISRLERIDARHGKRDGDFPYEPEYMKHVLESMCMEAGVRFQFHTLVTGVRKSADGRRIEAVETTSKAGRQWWRARCFVDTTGDGDLAALAGCGFDTGDGTGACQPASLDAILVVKDADLLKDRVLYADAGWECGTELFAADLARAGIRPSYGRPTLYRIHRHLLVMMANHEFNVPVDDPAAITEATVRARRENIELVRALSKLGGPWDGVRVVATAEQLGHRTARRIHGRYNVTREDVTTGRHFADGVALVTFPVDIHATDKMQTAVSNGGVKSQPFQIPLRALQARDVDNLYMAGRCLSGDYIAHAAYRTTGTAVATGEAVGKAAAAKSRCL